MSGAFQRTPAPGKSVFGAGVGFFKGYTALGLSYKQTNMAGDVTWGGGISTTGRQTGVNLGVGWEF